MNDLKSSSGFLTDYYMKQSKQIHMELLVIKLFSSNYARYPYIKAFDNLMTILFASSFMVVVAVVVAKEIQNAI